MFTYLYSIVPITELDARIPRFRFTQNVGVSTSWFLALCSFFFFLDFSRRQVGRFLSVDKRG
jgi:hypothetical protein